MRWLRLVWCLGVALFGLVFAVPAQERLPQQVAGPWRITRILSVGPTACWTEKEVEPLVGSTLAYAQTSMRWHGGKVPLSGVTTRLVTPEEFRKENAGGEAATAAGNGALTLEELGIRSTRGVLEVDMQHEDADVTGATTEVPGDSVLVAGPGRIVVSACGVYLEARRGARRQTPVVTASAGFAGGGKGW